APFLFERHSHLMECALLSRSKSKATGFLHRGFPRSVDHARSQKRNDVPMGLCQIGQVRPPFIFLADRYTDFTLRPGPWPKCQNREGHHSKSSKMAAPLSYIGGKNRLANGIIAIFPKHTTYVEAFAGGAQVFFRKEPSKVEVLNDLDGEIVNFYRVCQQHYEELLRYFRFAVVSRQWFDLLKATDPATLTNIHRAERHLYF